MYLIESHKGNDYLEVVDPFDEEQQRMIEEYCEICGDHDSIIGSADTYEDMAKLIRGQHYIPEYEQELLDEADDYFGTL